MAVHDLSLNDAQREHVALRLSGEDYRDEADYLTALIEDDRIRLEELRAAIQEGYDSGWSELSITEVIEEAKRDNLARSS